MIEPHTSQAGASPVKWENWALNCSKVFISVCNGPDVSVIVEPTRALIRPAGSVDMIFGSEEGFFAVLKAERAGFLRAKACALIFVPVFASAIFFARSFVFSTTSLAVVVFLLSFGAAAVLLGVFLSA